MRFALLAIRRQSPLCAATNFSLTRRMPPVATKATDFVHVPGDSRAWASFEHLFRNRASFNEALDGQHPVGLVFCPTRRKLPVDFPVQVLVRLGRRRPPLTLQGHVAWRRAGRHQEKLRAGVGVVFGDSERSKLKYILDSETKGDSLKSRRRHERREIELPVTWQTDGSRPITGTLRDIGRGGRASSSGSASSRMPSRAAVLGFDRGFSSRVFLF